MKKIFFGVFIVAKSICLAQEINVCADFEYWNVGLQSPWEDNVRLGIDLTQETCTDMMNDFEVYNSKLGAEYAYFSLYNRKTGVMRSFMYLKDYQVPNGNYFITKLQMTNGSQNQLTDHAHFNYEGGGYAFSVADRNTGNKMTMTYMTTYVLRNVWVIEDTYLSYDPDPRTSLALDYSIWSHNESQITMTGSAKPLVSQNVGGNAALSAILNNATGVPGAVSKSASTTQGVITSIRNLGENAVSNGASQVGIDLISLAQSVSHISGPIGIALTGSSLIKSFIQNQSANKVSFPEYLINLTGLITSQQTAGRYLIPVSSALGLQAPVNYSQRYSGNDERTLGLFNLKANLQARVYVWNTGVDANLNAMYEHWIYISDPITQMVVNPSSGAKVVSVQCMPVLTRAGNAIYFSSSFPRTTVGYNIPSWHHRRRMGTLVTNQQLQGPLDLDVKIRFVFDVGGGKLLEVFKTYNPTLTTYSSVPPSSGNFAYPYATLNQWTFNPLKIAVELGDTDVGLSEAGDAYWYAQSSEKTIGTKGVASGVIGDNQWSGMYTRVSAPYDRSVSFDWKVSSENGYDKLAIEVDGILYGEISGETNWERVTVPIPAGGIRTINWYYYKDSSLSYGLDRAYVDNVVFN